MTKLKKKSIYCIEGLWDHRNLQDKSTVLPILDLLYKTKMCDYVYNDCATKSELEFFLGKWKNKSINEKYPILYLAFHGEPGRILLSEKVSFTLNELAEVLKDKCSGKIIYFGSCSTLNVDKRHIKSFLVKTGAIAAIGYKTEVDWIQSTVCDLFVFQALQDEKFDTMGIAKIYTSIMHDYGNLHKKLNLSVVINDRQHFPRKRMHNN